MPKKKTTKKPSRKSAAAKPSQNNSKKNLSVGRVFSTRNNDVPVIIKTHKDKKGGHPHVIMEEFDRKHVSVGLTTKKKKGKNATNYSLEKSPLNDGKHSYMRRQGTIAPVGEYENPRKGSMAQKDFVKAKEYGEKAKQKYLEKKNKKK